MVAEQSMSMWWLVFAEKMFVKLDHPPQVGVKNIENSCPKYLGIFPIFPKPEFVWGYFLEDFPKPTISECVLG